MQLFYDPDVQAGTFTLREVEAKHAVQVLRKQVGDGLQLVDGKGGWYEGTIIEAGKKRCVLDVKSLRQERQRTDYQLTVAIAPTKAGDRFEWFLEKATEIGVDVIQPIISEHSERRNVRIDRLEKVVVAAMKQSLQAWKPKLLPLISLADYLESSRIASGKRLIAWIDKGTKSMITDNYRRGEDVSFLIGPEGGFARREAEQALELGWQPVSLGPNRLRTETAGIIAVQSIALVNYG